MLLLTISYISSANIINNSEPCKKKVKNFIRRSKKTINAHGVRNGVFVAQK